MAELQEAVGVLGDSGRILVFTGAGISTESGIPDFRGPDGLWTKVDPEDFNVTRFLADSRLRKRRWQMHAQGELWGARSTVTPNRGHLAIVDLERAGLLAGCVTQNVDGLHVVAGLAPGRVAELHGNVRTVRCIECGETWPIEDILKRVDAGEEDPPCRRCDGILKPSTVMFGEVLPREELRKAWAFAGMADAALVVGSTVGVFPAAEIPIRIAHEGRPLVIVNQGPTEADHLATVRLEGAAGVLLPALVSALVERAGLNR